MVFEGINFNADWVASITLKQFISHEKHHGLSRDRMEEIHRLCKELVKQKTNSGQE